jgi:hypothetical protein
MVLKSLQVDIISNIYVCFLSHLALAPYNFKKKKESRQLSHLRTNVGMRMTTRKTWLVAIFYAAGFIRMLEEVALGKDSWRGHLYLYF